jgi:hypothetical protein
VTDAHDVTNFRRWLVGKLAQSRWPVRKGDTDETMGKRLGVQPDVLAEAREVLRRQAEKTSGHIRRLGMPRALDGKGARYDVYLEPPEAISREWCAQRDRRRLTNAVLLRSAICHILTLPYQPAWIHSGRKAWRYRGQFLAQTNIRLHRFRLHTTLSETAFHALHARAEATRTTAGAIARWAVTAFLEGTLEREKTLWIVTGLDSLYRREHYVTTPTLVKE